MPLAAGVGRRAINFGHQQALARHRQIDAAKPDLVRQPVIIAVRIVTEKRQHEAVLAAGGSVATAGVAAGAHENRRHVEFETDRPLHARLATVTGTLTVWP